MEEKENLFEKHKEVKAYMDQMENLPTNSSELLQYAVTHYLRHLDFPANKPELIQQARYLSAPQEVMEALERAADKKYTRPEEIIGQLGTMQD